MNKRIIASVFTGLLGFGCAIGSLPVEPLGAATTAKKATPKPKAPKKIPATKAATKATPAKVATAPKITANKERLIPLGTPANLSFPGSNGKWTLRIMSAPTVTAGRWPGFEPELPPGRAWFSVAAEITNLNAELEAFPAVQVGFFLTDRRSENVTFAVTPNEYDIITKCHDEGMRGPEVASGATVRCQFFIETTAAEVPNIYAYVSEDPDTDRKRFLLR
jgi:hypothetical protein